jgi:hypothetical protein
MFISFLIFLTCGILTAINASTEGRNVFLWFVIGFLLGPGGLSKVIEFSVS